MAWKMFDYECIDCEIVFEELHNTDQENAEPCPDCGQLCTSVMSAPSLATFSLADTTTKSEILRKRSEQHTRKEIINKEAEKFGSIGKARAREGKVQVGYTGKK